MNLSFSRRLRRFPITSRILERVFIQGGRYTVRAGGLPEDVQVRWAAMDHSTGSIYLVLQSQEFDEVGEGEELPWHEQPWIDIDFCDCKHGES